MTDFTPSDYAESKGRFCDIVMKGGVTSGIVYPPAICALASQYDVRCIGGTSVGAIAAAIAAAAEYRRRVHKSGEGYVLLSPAMLLLGVALATASAAAFHWPAGDHWLSRAWNVPQFPNKAASDAAVTTTRMLQDISLAQGVGEMITGVAPPPVGELHIRPPA